MKISHYITFNNGGGPVTLVSVVDGEEEIMLRIVHEAKFGGVGKVDAAAARQAVTQASDLGEATTSIPHELRQRITNETMTIVANAGRREQALRWSKSGEGLLFADEAAALAWDSANVPEAEHGALVRTRRRVMMG